MTDPQHLALLALARAIDPSCFDQGPAYEAWAAPRRESAYAKARKYLLALDQAGITLAAPEGASPAGDDPPRRRGHVEKCPRCGGAGTIWDPARHGGLPRSIPCPACGGIGLPKGRLDPQSGQTDPETEARGSLEWFMGYHLAIEGYPCPANYSPDYKAGYARGLLRLQSGPTAGKPGSAEGQADLSPTRLAAWTQGYRDAKAGRAVNSSNTAYQAGYGAGLADRGTP